MLERRVLCHGSGPDVLARAETAILAAGAEATRVEERAGVSAALEADPDAFDAVVISCEPDEDPTGWEALLQRLDEATRPPTVLLLLEGDTAPFLQWMSRSPSVSHLLALRGNARDGEQLRVALSKVFRKDPFGLAHYLGRGTAVHRLTVADSRDKGAYVREVASLAQRFTLAPRVVELVETVTDELSTNAIFNAPVDAKGQARYATLNRREAVALEPHEEAELRYGCDGTTFGVAVRDPFGSLSRETLVKYLTRCLQQAPAELITETGGAGLGLYRVYLAISRFVINIHPGQGTEAIGLLDVQHSIKEIKTLPRSLHLFVQEVGT